MDLRWTELRAAAARALRRALARLLPTETLHYIGGSDTLPPPLTREREAELLARLDGGDESVKRELIEHNLRLMTDRIHSFSVSMPTMPHWSLWTRMAHHKGLTWSSHVY